MNHLPALGKLKGLRLYVKQYGPKTSPGHSFVGPHLGPYCFICLHVYTC